MPLRSAVDPTRATTREVKSFRMTRAADAAAPTAMKASLLRATRCSDPAHFDDGALLVAAPTTEQEGDDHDRDAGNDQTGLGGALGDLGGVVGDALDLGELGFDVGAGDRLFPSWNGHLSVLL